MSETLFPEGTPVRVVQSTVHCNPCGGVQTREAVVVGVVESWQARPTGSWHARGKHDKLWLDRLRLRKVDGEITLLVIDDGTRIAKLEQA